MPPESVVDALRKVHRSLKPAGVMLDIHPRAMPSPLAVQSGAELTPLGQIAYSQTFNDTIGNAMAVLESQEKGRAFRREDQQEFSLLHRYASFEEWQTYMTDQAPYYFTPNAALVETMRGLAAAPGAEIILEEHVRATRFRKGTALDPLAAAQL